MDYEQIRVERREAVALLTLHRPDRLNAWTPRMSVELVDAIERANQDREVGAIVVTGAGRAFCAGMDLASSGNVFGLDESQHPTLRDMHEKGAGSLP